MRQCVIGIDGGGTKTHLLCLDLEGNLLAEAYGGSSNLCSNSEEMVCQSLRELFEKTTQLIEEEFEIVSVCLGTAGLIAEHATERLSEMIQELTTARTIQVVGDMETALVANLNQEAGVLIISGTGAIAYGIDLNHQSYRSGGWGHLVGDEGSAYWIAAQGLRMALKSYDGRGEKTSLYEAFQSSLNCFSHRALISKIYRLDFNKSDMATLSRIVGEVAKSGDAVAIEILCDAGSELAQLAASVITQLELNQLETFKVITTGSVLLNNEIVYRSFSNHLMSIFPQAYIKVAKHSAAYGATKIALNSIMNM